MRLFYQRPPEDQILVTFGIGIVLVEAVRAVFGSDTQHMPAPSWGEGVTRAGLPDLSHLPAGADRHHRGDAAGTVHRAVPHLDRPGGAGRDRGCRAWSASLASTCRRTFLLVFAIGVVAAGFAGMLYGADHCRSRRRSGERFLVQAFVVIVIGGLGSFPGAVVGGLIAGEIISITSAFNSAYSEVMLYAVMALLLVARPQGLFGTEGRV